LLDIKPRSCPNPLDVKSIPKSGSVVPVAILGTETFDVRNVDVYTLLLEGVPPIHWEWEDVATAMDEPPMDCECIADGPDGFEDLTLKFYKDAIVAALLPVVDGEYRVLTLTGELLDGTPFETWDCMWIRKQKDKNKIAGMPVPNIGLSNYPNPFNAATTIEFTLSEDAFVQLDIFDALGRRVTKLVSDHCSAGSYAEPWNGHDSRDRQVAAGIYFYRLAVGNQVLTRKMVLLK
jgi:hypothetical protein